MCVAPYAFSGSRLNIGRKRCYYACMRTTLTLDDDLADALKERARLTGAPFKQVVNDTLRRGMSQGAEETPRREYSVVPLRGGLAPGVDPLKLNQLNDQLADEEFIRRNPI